MMPEPKLVVPDHVVSQCLEEETVLLDMRSGAYFGLTPVASRIWSMVVDGSTQTEMVQKLALEFDAPAEQIEQDLTVLLQRLREKKLLES
jgi:hypothetical protein